MFFINRKYHIFLLLLLLPLNLFSEDWLCNMTSTYWKYNNDFPANNALDIEQDFNGYIWIASYEGLIRFDGVDFKIFKNNRGGYPSDTARVLLKGSDTKLWIGTNSDGLILMDNYKFIVYGTESGLPDLSVRSLSFDRNGNLWVGTAGGLLFVPAAGFDSPEKKIFLESKIITSLYLDNRGILTAVTNEGKLYSYTGSSFAEYSPPVSKSSEQYTSVFSDSSNRNWFGTVSGSVILEKENNIREFRMENVFSIKGFLETSDSKIWFWSEGGIGYFDESYGSFRIINEENGLINNSVNSLFQDREDNLWVISDVSGMQKYSMGKFTNYSNSYGLEKAVNTIIRYDSSSLMAGTDDGLYNLSGDRIIENSLTESLKGTRIRNIYKDSKSRLWISTYSSSGLIVADKGRIIRSLNSDNGLSFNKTRTVIESSDSYIWSGTRSGLNKINPETFEIENIYTVNNGLSNDYILSLHENRDGSILIGTDGGGINILDTKSGKIEVVTSDSGRIAGDIVFRITEDAEGNTWICTNKGVSIWFGEEIYHISERNGLDSNAVFFYSF